MSSGAVVSGIFGMNLSNKVGRYLFKELVYIQTIL